MAELTGRAIAIGAAKRQAMRPAAGNRNDGRAAIGRGVWIILSPEWFECARWKRRNSTQSLPLAINEFNIFLIALIEEENSIIYRCRQNATRSTALGEQGCSFRNETVIIAIAKLRLRPFGLAEISHLQSTQGS